MKKRVLGIGAGLLFGLAVGLFSAAPGWAQEPARPAFTEATFWAHLRFLSDDLLEGRGIATRGGRVAAAYIESVFRAAGLQGGFGGSFRQPVPMYACAPDAKATLVLGKGTPTVKVALGDDFILDNCGLPAGVLRGEPLFVGYAIDAPEESWNDFKDVDVRGKLLIAFTNEPGRDDPALFRGKELTIHGRWRTKFQEAARRGAAGMLLIHTDEDAGYTWDVLRNVANNEEFQLVDDPEVLGISGWLAQATAADLVRLAGHDLAELRAEAAKRSFKPIPLHVVVEVRAALQRRTVEGANVVGILPGRGSEAVVITAHYDHLGIGRAIGGDAIYNGAIDNGTALATLLSLAQGYARTARASHPPLVFVAADAEESGILGSTFYTRHPATPVARTLATVNFEMVNPWGKTRDVMAIGAAHSTLAELIDHVLVARGLHPTPDPAPEQGYFFRSDQLAWAQAGVPTVWLDGGIDYVGKPAGWGEAKRAEFRAKTYHQPTDEVRDDFDMSGLVQLAEITVDLVGEIAAAGKVAYKPSSEFSRVRR
jgi:Zn-dependent M28 family amino/carboxypeptidase